MKKILGILLLATILSGCSNPKSVVIPNNPNEWDTIKPQVEKLNEDEKKLLTQYLMRKAMGSAFGGNGIQTGTTVGEAIKDQEKWLADKKAQEQAEAELKMKIEAQKKQEIDKINKILTVALTKKEGHSSYGNDITNIGIELAFENKGDKDISGVKGIAHFNDMFDDKIQAVSLSYDDGVKAKSTAVYRGSLDYNQFMDKDIKLLNTDLNKLKFIFEPQVILFSDGSKVEISDK